MLLHVLSHYPLLVLEGLFLYFPLWWTKQCFFIKTTSETTVRVNKNLLGKDFIGKSWGKEPGQLYLPTTCGREEASISSMIEPFSIHVRNSNKLCRDKVATWGLLHRSPPCSTFSSNLIHLREGKATRPCSSCWLLADTHLWKKGDSWTMVAYQRVQAHTSPHTSLRPQIHDQVAKA